jgi:hypothetical protein
MRSKRRAKSNPCVTARNSGFLMQVPPTLEVPPGYISLTP